MDVRIIAATNRDLRELIKSNQFREDLFFRLNVFPIECLSLRQRADDIPQLAMHFLKHACGRFNKPGLRLSQADCQRLQSYNWPGNIRELQNVIERAVILSKGDRLTIDVPMNNNNNINNQTEKPVTLVSREEFKRQEKLQIIQALKQCQGRIFGEQGAANILDIKPTTLASKIKRLGINRYQFKS